MKKGSPRAFLKRMAEEVPDSAVSVVVTWIGPDHVKGRSCSVQWQLARNDDVIVLLRKAIDLVVTASAHETRH